MAQDFYAAFGLGDDNKHIATIDESGVALAAIQGLNVLMKEKDQRISTLEREVSSLRSLVAKQAASAQALDARFAAVERSLDRERESLIARSADERIEH